jgi:hypothetical protein
MGSSQIQAKMSDSTGSQTPLQEAVSIITIATILISVGCYLAAIHRVPVITSGLWWVAERTYEFFPALARLPGAKMPILAASAAGGSRSLCSRFPSPTGWQACSPGLATRAWTARQRQLKRFREKRKNYKRNRDDFSIGREA